MMSASRPAIVILAAGGSTRMGQPKQTLLYKGMSLLRRAAEAALAADVGPVLVILGACEHVVRQTLCGLPVVLVVNRSWREGMASSIRAGVQAAHEAPAVVLLPCDVPLLTAAVIRSLVEKYHQGHHTVVACRYGEVTGIPALFDRSLFDELAALEGDTGARKVLRAQEAAMGIIPFEGGLIDVDTPEQFETLVGQNS